MKRIQKPGFFTLIMLTTATGFAQDPNFFIFLCFGQSNMEGQGTVENQDKTVDSRFKVFQAVDCSNISRAKGAWYDATPPLCRCWSGLSPADYFGRTLVEGLPEHIKIGIINVSVGGCKIELFDKDIYENYKNTYTEDWFQNTLKEYEGNPYEYLLNLAKSAQKDGVIKGILLHQGESNSGDKQWPAKVKKIYGDLMTDLNLNPEKTPLLAGELVHEDQNGITASMNTIINQLPETLNNAYVISSSGCPAKSDNIHFNAAGYRELGKRYGEKMLTLLDYNLKAVLNTEISSSNFELRAVYPNPVTGSASISFSIPTKSWVVINIHDNSGKQVEQIISKKFKAGKHQLAHNLSHLSPGIYLCKLSTERDTLVQKIIVR